MAGRLLQSPIFPAAPEGAEDLSFWGRQFTEAVSRAFEDAANRIETLNTTETIEGTIPDAEQKRTFYYDETNDKLFFDNGTWVEIGFNRPAPIEVTANHTITQDNELVLADASGGAITVTLPAPLGGYTHKIKKIDSSTNAVTVSAGGVVLIDDSVTTFDLEMQDESIIIEDDENGWWIV